eukprot:SAG25_NODE_384_length_8785_cov_7.011628_5_plen_225_part_00
MTGCGTGCGAVFTFHLPPCQPAAGCVPACPILVRLISACTFGTFSFPHTTPRLPPPPTPPHTSPHRQDGSNARRCELQGARRAHVLCCRSCFTAHASPLMLRHTLCASDDLLWRDRNIRPQPLSGNGISGIRKTCALRAHRHRRRYFLYCGRHVSQCAHPSCCALCPGAVVAYRVAYRVRTFVRFGLTTSGGERRTKSLGSSRPSSPSAARASMLSTPWISKKL